MMEFRNPVFTKSGGVLCEVNHPSFGWIPFHAVDGDAASQAIYNAASSTSSPYVDDPVPLAVPVVVSRFQARAALLDAGILADAELAIAASDVITKLAWAEASEWRRDSPTISVIAAALDLSSERVDELFIEASKIVA